MIKIAILGDIGSGKSYIAKEFGLPVFNADKEVAELYKKNKKVFINLKKVLPKYFFSLPINKVQVTDAILANKKNLTKIVKIVHLEIKKKLTIFLKKNKNQKIVILDIPLFLENKLNNKRDILIFIQSKKIDTLKRLKKRNNYNSRLYKKFKDIQLSLEYKKKKSKFIIKNDFTKKSVKKDIRNILEKIK